MICAREDLPLRRRFETIDRARSRLGISVGQLCRRADVSEAAYYRLRRYIGRQPNFRTVEKLASALSQFERR